MKQTKRIWVQHGVYRYIVQIERSNSAIIAIPFSNSPIEGSDSWKICAVEIPGTGIVFTRKHWQSLDLSTRRDVVAKIRQAIEKEFL